MIINGNNWNNTQYGTNYNDAIYGYAGDDTQYGYSGNDYLFGGDGNDFQNGGYDNDDLYGGNGNDIQYGSYGHDYLSGDAGYDYLNGGDGVDTLVGGTGADSLVGGNDTSTDYFRFGKYDSFSHSGSADTIYDWNASYDFIDSPMAGLWSSYDEAPTGATSIDSVRHQVENSSTLKQKDHVFLYNASTDTGYLLSDLDSNYTFETGVIINGAGSQYDMSGLDIIQIFVTKTQSLPLQVSSSSYGFLADSFKADIGEAVVSGCDPAEVFEAAEHAVGGFKKPSLAQ